MSSRIVPTAKHFRAQTDKGALPRENGSVSWGEEVFEAVLTEMREEVSPAYGKTYGFHREPSPREERGTNYRELRGESKASDLQRGRTRRI